METATVVTTSAERKKIRKHRKVPEILIYEIMDGKPIYYQGYKSVLNKTKKPEDIMGSSSLQSILVIYVLTKLIKSINQNDYWLMTNEAGIHLDHRNNLAGDIMIYEKNRLKGADITDNYVKVPANIMIEVDTKADLSLLKFEQYLKLKTTKLHDFGVEKVIWILTASKQVVVAIPGNDWLMIDWNKDIEILPKVTINIGAYLIENGIALLNTEEA